MLPRALFKFSSITLSAYKPLIIIPEQMNKVKNSAAVELAAI